MNLVTFAWVVLNNIKEMRILVAEKEGKTTVALSGQLDTLTSVEFEKTVTEIINSSTKHVILNCEGLSYISSAGLRLLLSLQKAIKVKTGTLVLEKVEPSIMDILKITGFASFLTIR